MAERLGVVAGRSLGAAKAWRQTAAAARATRCPLAVVVDDGSCQTRSSLTKHLCVSQLRREGSTVRYHFQVLKLHSNSQTSQKKPRGGELNPPEKHQNRVLASRRVVGEHVIGKLKVFRILAEKYRNRRRRFGVRLNLLASLYNLDLKLLG
jgi:hypothetical protein